MKQNTPESTTIELRLAALMEAVSGKAPLEKPSDESDAWLEPLDHDFLIQGVREPQEAGPLDVSFLIGVSFVEAAAQGSAGVLVVQEALWPALKTAFLKFGSKAGKVKSRIILCADAYRGLAKVSALWAKLDRFADWQPATDSEQFVARTDGAWVHKTAVVHASAKLSPGVVVCESAQLEANVVCLPNVVVGPVCRIGEGSRLFPGVIMYPRTTLGKNVRVHSNVVLGSDGFGYARGPQGAEKIWHLGKVVIGDGVEIGAGTCVDRGTLKDTIVETGAKIDNLVQIGHNGHIKPHAILCAQTGLAGNVTVGAGAILAGQAGIADKVEIGDLAVIGPKAGISKDVPAKETLLGTLISKPRRQWWKLNALFDRLPELFERVKKLEQKGEK